MPQRLGGGPDWLTSSCSLLRERSDWPAVPWRGFSLQPVVVMSPSCRPELSTFCSPNWQQQLGEDWYGDPLGPLTNRSAAYWYCTFTDETVKCRLCSVSQCCKQKIQHEPEKKWNARDVQNQHKQKHLHQLIWYTTCCGSKQARWIYCSHIFTYISFLLPLTMIQRWISQQNTIILLYK